MPGKSQERTTSPESPNILPDIMLVELKIVGCLSCCALWKDEGGPSSIRPTLELFQRQHLGELRDGVERIWFFFLVHRYHLELNGTLCGPNWMSSVFLRWQDNTTEGHHVELDELWPAVLFLWCVSGLLCFCRAVWIVRESVCVALIECLCYFPGVFGLL